MSGREGPNNLEGSADHTGWKPAEASDLTRQSATDSSGEQWSKGKQITAIAAAGLTLAGGIAVDALTEHSPPPPVVAHGKGGSLFGSTLTVEGKQVHITGSQRPDGTITVSRGSDTAGQVNIDVMDTLVSNGKIYSPETMKAESLEPGATLNAGPLPSYANLLDVKVSVPNNPDQVEVKIPAFSPTIPLAPVDIPVASITESTGAGKVSVNESLLFDNTVQLKADTSNKDAANVTVSTTSGNRELSYDETTIEPGQTWRSSWQMSTNAEWLKLRLGKDEVDIP